MRGIAFIGGEGPPPEYCAGLTAGAALVVAADSGLAAAEAAGVRPHWITGDMDSLDDLRRLEQYPPDRILRYPPDKDFTDTELALNLLWERGCDETWIVGGGGGRTDHLLAIRSLLAREKTPDRWLTAADDIRRLREGECLGVDLPPGSRVSVFPLADGPWQAASRSLKWPLDRVSWNRGYAGISNVTTEGFLEIEVRQGRFLVFLPLGSG
jgi:thiamine pyrophosphokinase